MKIFYNMLTAHTIKILKSLDRKKFRQKYNLFLVEGNKIIKELNNTDYKIREIFSADPSSLEFFQDHITEISPAELQKISFLQHPKDSVALCELPESNFTEDFPRQIVLDGIQDPGNFGTIIRLADWFGIEQIVCSTDTVDLYNPKVIQASMGSFTRVKTVYTDLPEFLKNTSNENIGTDMDGENVFAWKIPLRFNLILGNEGNGIRPETERLLNKKITIPRFGHQKATESLNVSMAAGIILGQIFSGKAV